MKKLFLYFFMSLFLMSVVFNVEAATLNVPGGYGTIQAAITAAATGDIINVAAGTYNEDLIIPATKTNLDIIGAGTTIKGVQNVPTASFPLAAPNIEIRANGVKLHGFTIQSPNYEVGKYSSGIVIGAINVEIYNNNFIMNSGGGADSGEVSQAIQTYATAAVPGVDISGLNIHDNTFSSIGGGAWGYEGIYINPDAATNTVTIQKNTFSGKILRAITSERSKTTITENSIITDLVPGPGNLTVAGAHQGINVRNLGFATQSSILINLNTIKGSASDKGFNQGIRVGQAGQTLTNFQVIDNIISYNTKGILVKEASGVTVTENDIIGNNIGIQNDDTSSLNAEKNYWGACDGPSTIGTGHGDHVSTLVDFTPWIGACITGESIDPTCVLESDDVKLITDVDSDFPFCNVDLSVKIGGDSWVDHLNIPKDLILNKYVFTLDKSLIDAGDLVQWKYSVDDCYGHSDTGVVQNFNVKSMTRLTVNPVNPDGLNTWYKTEPEFTLTNPDATNKWYRWDSTGSILYNLPFGLGDIPNPGSAGTLELTWWSDICSEAEQNQIFKIDLTSPQIKNVNPVEDSTIINPKPLISADLDDVYQSNSGIDLNNIVFKLDGEEKTINPPIVLDPPTKYRITYQVPTDLSIGDHTDHTVEIKVRDRAGNPEVTKTWTFTYSPISVDVNIVSPVEGNYFNNKKVMLNVDTNEVLKDLTLEYNENNKGWNRLCTRCNEYNKEKSFKDGETNLKVRAIKNFAVAGEDSVTFSIDSKKPKINSIAPKDNTYSNGNNFNVKYNEENLKEIILHLVKDETDVPVTLTGCESGMNKECSIDHSLNAYDGETIQYYFVVKDQVNEVSSKIYDLIADTSAPVLTINSPLIGISYNKKIQFDIGINEKVKILEYNDNDAGYRRLCSNCVEYKRSKTLSEGLHILKIRATDYAGNMAEQIVNFIVSS